MSNTFYTSVERYGNNILYRGYENGQRVNHRIPFSPTLYVHTKKSEGDYKSLYGDLRLNPQKFGSMSEAKEFIEMYKDVANFGVYGNTNYIAQFIQEEFPNDITFNISLINIVSFDIEVDISDGYPDVETADKEITSVSYKSSKSDKYFLLGRKDFDKTKTITGIDPDDIVFVKFDTETAMLSRFIELWKADYPDVVTGWNVEYFDVQYIVTRVKRLFGEEKARDFSPWRSIKATSREMFGKKQSTYNISGISVIDYMDAFKKFGYKYGPQESYKLDHIAHTILGEKKLDYSEYGTLTELYEQNPQLYLDYNLQDTRLIQRFEEETGLLSLVMTVAYSGGVNYNDAFGTVGIWESTIYRKLIKDNIVPPIKGGPGFRSDLVGGFVKDPKVGMHEWVVAFDLNSLYPHLMMQFNMSPETYLKNEHEYVTQEMVLNGEFKNNNKDVSVGANGTCFDNRKLGVIPEIIETYYGNRKKIKTEMLEVEKLVEIEKDPVKLKELKKQASQLHNSQMAIKIAMNSLYGAVANVYFLYYINDMAEAITKSGQLAIRCAEKSVNDYLNKILKTNGEDYIVYIDTDSIYVDFAPLVKATFGTTDISRDQGEQFLDKICSTKIEQVIENGYVKMASDMGAYRNAMVMKREKISDKAVFIAKKRYIMNVLNSEGVHYDKPKISVTGLESVRSSTPEVCRTKMKESFEVIMNGTETDVQEFIKNFKTEFYSLPAEVVGKTSGTNDLVKYTDKDTIYKKGTPGHVRGALLYNALLKKQGLDKKYQPVIGGDKVKFLYLKTPNPIRENVVSFIGALPPELGLEKYIDYETQFDKVFLGPVAAIVEAIGWSAEKRDTLDDFFC